jgi:hypothetical protein
MPDVLVLESDQTVPGRPFTDVARSAEDLAALRRIRRSLRERLTAGLGAGTWSDAAGDGHLLVVPDPGALATVRPAHAVGFFGQARDDVDHAPIIAIEQELLGRAAGFDGLLAYHNVRFADGGWGNLVVFADDVTPGRLRDDERHLVAVGRTPLHYRSLRLHRALLPAGALGREDLELRRTAYFDFDENPPWRAVRTVGP